MLESLAEAKNRIYRLPMRDGNSGRRRSYSEPGWFYRLPMRDGNSEAGQRVFDARYAL